MQDPRHVVSQCKYVLNLLKETRMFGCKLLDTPMEIVTKDSEEIKNGIYQKLVGRFIYLSHTRLDISFAVSVEFMTIPFKSI